MSTVSFSGLATGLDTATLVSQLVELKRAPIYRLQSQRKGYENQLAALGTLKTKLEALQAAAQKLDTANEFASLAATSSDEDVLTVTANGTAAPGTYDISVTALAQAQKSRSQGYDNTLVAIGEGTLSITIGEEVQTLELTGYTSLQDLADRINSEVSGVSATIIFDGSETGGYYLTLTGEDGTGGAFTVDATGLGGGAAPAFTEVQAAADATLTIDGLAVTANGNHLSGIISGLTIDLQAVSAPDTTVRVVVETDAAGVKDQVKALVDAYNDLYSFLETETKSGGKLYGNSAARSVGQRMENVMSAAHAGGGAFTILAQVGIERQQGTRTLKFDESKFATAVAENYAAVRDLFIERDGNLGKASLIDTAIEDLTDSIDGVFKLGTDSLNRRIDTTDQTIERYEMSIENYRTTLERKFLAMESAVSLLQAQGNYLSSIYYYSN
ncbi:MAG TPA: flagellar filament capping protein FliD [Candidatus Krumholzibacteria bacterium]|nr:flagellar filament capping protein FliD [Candidatus Krumholzibacteria bacterium]HPD71649.1 flagellar filament capping protein FliD [Candidatus Krumholzibacteria bacterium]HRY41418.1 flagellar filament capping protein FliD [Candidatus Krumholzibacteria bacterium]